MRHRPSRTAWDYHGRTSENVLKNHTSYAANSEAELANDELMETVYRSRSINFQFRLLLDFIVNDFPQLFRSSWNFDGWDDEDSGYEVYEEGRKTSLQHVNQN